MSVSPPRRRSSIPSHRESAKERSKSFSRSVSPRSDSRGRSASRSPAVKRDAGHRNGSQSRSRSRSPSRTRGARRYRSRSRSRSRGRSYTRSPSPNEGAPRSSKVVVEKLTKNVTDAHLHEIFGRFGDIQQLDLPMNRAFMTNRGTAYILYYDPADAEAAIAHMHEAQLDGAVLNVSIVLPRRAFSHSPPAPRGRRPSLDRPKYGGGRRGSYPHRSPPPPRRYARNRASERHDVYRPRSISRSRSPRRSRSLSRSPPRRRPSPRRRGRRSPSYSSYSRSPSYSRSRSRSRSRGRYSRD
ncbi:hypothetical protein PHISP_02233 [Aspergillus sp. HF37]|nr:hypothetical protein PHISP_02233 [Aspergillus sp. HF37]